MTSTEPDKAASFTAFLNQHLQTVKPLDIETAEAWWQTNISATPENEARAAAAQKALTRVYADRDRYQALRAIDPTGLPTDDARQHRLLLNTFTGSQMDDAVIEELVDLETRVESQYNNHRPLLQGEPTGDNRLREILRTSDDAALRKEAWEAGKEIGQVVAADVLRMVALRNQEAQKLGYTDYYTMSLSLQEQDVTELFRLFDDLGAQTDTMFAEFKASLDADLARKFGITPAELRPWHYGDPFFQEAPTGDADLSVFYQGKNIEALTTALFDAIGLDIRDILQRSDLYERDGKSQHAFCLTVGKEGDVRVLCNITSTEYWMGTMLHEFGHAIYDKYLEHNLPYFLREPAHTLTTEAIAMLFGRLSRHPDFLSSFVGVSAEEAEAVSGAAAATTRAGLLILVRWVLVMVYFERALYADPSQNLNALWWELVQKYQGITPPEGRDAPDWAAKLHLALAPAYYHNYLMGEMLASQLMEYIEREVIGDGIEADWFRTTAAGEYLKSEVFGPGARLPWDQHIAAATGEPLNPRYFVQHLR